MKRLFKLWRKKWFPDHVHYMVNFSSGYTWRYCVMTVWDDEQKKRVKCPYEDNKAGSLSHRA
jgi:hypothetical protein